MSTAMAVCHCDKNTRAKIHRDFGKYEDRISMEEMGESPSDAGYGDGGNMNVIFYKKC